MAKPRYLRVQITIGRAVRKHLSITSVLKTIFDPDYPFEAYL